MAQNSGSGAAPWIAFLVGGLLVAVAVIAYFMYGGSARKPAMPENVNIDVNLPKAPPIPDAPRLPDNPIPTPK